MQYTQSLAQSAHPRPDLLPAPAPTLAVCRPGGTWHLPLPSLPALFATIADPRTPRGRRYPLPALLAATLAGLLCNHLSHLAIAEWLADQAPAIQAALGFQPGRTPHQSTFHRVLRRLDPAAVAAVLPALFDPPPLTPRPRASQGVAVDGKAQRGRLHFTAAGPGTCPIHEVSAFCAELGQVLAAAAVVGYSDKPAAELNTTPPLVAQVNWGGRVLTGDALLCQRSLCEQVVAAGGDYLFTVKANQGHLLEQMERLFAPLPPRRYGYAQVAGDERTGRRCEKGHGRIEVHTIRASADLAGLVDWPHLAQVFVVQREWWDRAGRHEEQHWGVTSLPGGVADVTRLLAVRRGHWRVENSLHYVKDVTLGEDRSLIHLGQGPAVMSLLRDVVVSLVHRAGYDTVAARLRYYSRHPAEALALLGLTESENA